LYYSKSSCDVDDWLSKRLVVESFGDASGVNVWNASRPLEGAVELSDRPPPDAGYVEPAAALQQAKHYGVWERQLKEYLYREQPLRIWCCNELKTYSRPEESDGDFRVRLEQLASERRDQQIDDLRKKYAPKFHSLADRIQRGQTNVEREREQYQQRRLDSILRTGSTILGALLGRKRLTATNVSKASTSVRSYGRAASAREDVERAEESVESLQERMAELQAEFDAELAALNGKLRGSELDLEEIQIRPRKSAIQLEKFGVLWLPTTIEASD
jgi:hypothetical protein